MGKSKELAELGQVVTQDGGNVGIGSNPIASSKVLVTHSGSTFDAVRVNSDTVTDNTGIYLRTTGTAGISFGSTSSLAFFGGGAGLTERMRIDASGRVTMPYQPAAFVAISNGGSWSAFNGTIVFNNVKLNRGNHYNNANGIFTCPVDGVYRVHAEMLSGYNTGASHLYIYKNGVQVTTQGAHSNYQGTAYWTMGTEALLACSQNDQLSVYATNSNASVYLQSEYTKATFALIG